MPHDRILELAIIGAGLRLREIIKEQQVIHGLFPDLSAPSFPEPVPPDPRPLPVLDILPPTNGTPVIATLTPSRQPMSMKARKAISRSMKKRWKLSRAQQN